MIILNSESVTAVILRVDSNQIFLNDTDQRIHVAGCDINSFLK